MRALYSLFTIIPSTNFACTMRYKELPKKRMRASKRLNKGKSAWKLYECNRVCSVHFVGCTYEANSVSTLNLAYEIEEKKERSIFPKLKTKENQSIQECIVPLTVFTPEQQHNHGSVKCSTPYDVLQLLLKQHITIHTPLKKKTFPFHRI